MDLYVRQSAEFGAPYASCCVDLRAKPHATTIDEGVCHRFPRKVFRDRASKNSVKY